MSLRRLVVPLALGLSLISASPASAATSWSSGGLVGVQASGTYTSTLLTGRLYDTQADARSVKLLVRSSGKCCATVIENRNGSGTSVPVSVSVSGTIDVKECKFSTWTNECSDWKRV